MSRRRKTIKVESGPDSAAVVGRLGTGDVVTLVCGDIEITTTVSKLERAAQYFEY